MAGGVRPDPWRTLRIWRASSIHRRSENLADLPRFDELEGVRPLVPAWAGGHIQQHLAGWGVTPAGDTGSFLQTVESSASRRRVVLPSPFASAEKPGPSGTARRTFARNSGARQTLTLDRVEFVGAASTRWVKPGLRQPVTGAAVDHSAPRGLVDGCGSISAPIGHAEPLRYRTAVGGGGYWPAVQRTGSPGGRTAIVRPATQPDFTTVQRLDQLLPPAITADDRSLISFSAPRPTAIAI